MTPKEKAEALVNRIYGCAEINEHTAKRCALIAVDEILDLFLEESRETKYWEEVEQEIKNI
jgi:hypothetical protein